MMALALDTDQEKYKQKVLARNRKERQICRRLAPAIGLIAAVYGLTSEQAVLDRVSISVCSESIQLESPRFFAAFPVSSMSSLDPARDACENARRSLTTSFAPRTRDQLRPSF